MTGPQESDHEKKPVPLPVALFVVFFQFFGTMIVFGLIMGLVILVGWLLAR